MQIAELFVRLRGDTTDLHRKLTDAERALLGLERRTTNLNSSMKATGLQTGRLGNQFAGLAGQIAGVHPVVGNLAGVLGNFAIGAGMTVGILAGVAAIAVAYDQLTKSSREATKEQNNLIAALEKSIHLKALGPGGEAVDQVKAANARAAALKIQIANLDALIVKDAMDADVLASNLIIQEKINKLVIERQNALNIAAGGKSIVDEKVGAAIEANIPKVKALTSNFNELRDAAEEAQLQAQIGALKLGMTLDELGKIAALNADIADHIKFGGMPNIGLDDGLTKEQIKSREKLIGNADKNTDKLHNAIWGSALQGASIVVNALNIGGGGRGSGIGGALGGVLGAGLTAGAGMLTSGLWGVAGTIVGSLFGGLFDSNKKALNKNTLATMANTHVMEQLLNAPSGFRVASYRYGSTAMSPDIDAIATAERRRASRGGTSGRGNL